MECKMKEEKEARWKKKKDEDKKKTTMPNKMKTPKKLEVKGKADVIQMIKKESVH